jgi:hypothetical protein
MPADAMHNAFQFQFHTTTNIVSNFFYENLKIYNFVYLFFRPTCCTVEDLATDLRARDAEVPVSEPLPNDLPPKYDDLEQPPRYEDQVDQNNTDQQRL